MKADQIKSRYLLEQRGRLWLSHPFRLEAHETVSQHPSTGRWWVGTGCPTCPRLAWLARATWNDVQHEYDRGGITYDEMEAWRWLWCHSAYRYTELGRGWEKNPLDPYVCELIDAIHGASDELGLLLK